MTTTLLSLVIIWMAVLPGALFIWAFEMLAGRWTTGIRGGLLRSVGYSAVFHLVFLPLTYHLRVFYWDRIWEGRYVNPWVWAYLSVYVLVPIVLGLLTGLSVRQTYSSAHRRYRWARLLIGKSPAPRAWDFLFGQNVIAGWVRFRTKSGLYMGGYYGEDSYVSRYPEPQDIYIGHAVEIDPDSGNIVRDSEGVPRLLPSGLLIRWDEVEYLEFTPGEVDEEILDFTVAGSENSNTESEMERNDADV